MVSPFSLIVIWHITYGMYIPFYSILPLVIALYLKLIKQKSNNIVGLTLIIFFSSINTSFPGTELFVLLLFIVFTYFIFLIIKERKCHYKSIISITIKFLIFIIIKE